MFKRPTFDDGSNIDIGFCCADSEPSTQSILLLSIGNLQCSHGKMKELERKKKKSICVESGEKICNLFFFFLKPQITLLKARESKRGQCSFEYRQ